MRSRYYFTALVYFALACLAGCQKSEVPPAVSPERVFVIFEGPWAILADPKDPNSILAVAPKTKSHRALVVSPANTPLDAGVYELAIPAHGTPAPLKLDASFLRADVQPKNVQRILDDRLERYAIRMPKPEGFVAASRHRSRVGSSYPPDVSNEQNYVTSVSLRYSVESLTGLSLAGTKDAGGAFNPVLLQLDTPIVQFVIDPAQDFGPDACGTHSRQAFSDLVKLLGVTLYVDFPEDPSDCHKKDPQLAGTARAGSGIAHMRTGILATYFGAARIVEGLAATFFHSDFGACLAPIIIGD